MAKTFRPWEIDQSNLFPPSVRDFVPEGHLAHFVRDTVRESLDLSSILGEYDEERGFPPYHPAMMVALLLYGYSRGVYSSRKLAQACEERVDFIALTGMQRPDFRTIAKFRRRHLEALDELFVQVLALCEEAGLVKLGHVSLDGTKIKANASKRKAMSYKRMNERLRQLRGEVTSWLERAAKLDDAEDKDHGADLRGDELPDWVKNKQARIEKIEAARKALQAMAQEEARGQGAHDDDTQGPTPPASGGESLRPASSAVPKAKAQRNFTDPDSRIMKTSGGFEQCFNATIAVEHGSQVILARHVTQDCNDTHELVPLLEQVDGNVGHLPAEVSVDANFCSEANLQALQDLGVEAYVATGRRRHGDAAAIHRSKPPKPGTLVHAMQLRLQRGGHRGRYRLRKVTVEPVFGQIKEARGFRRFLLRGLHLVSLEWSLICTAHNLLKLAARTT